MRSELPLLFTVCYEDRRLLTAWDLHPPRVSGCLGPARRVQEALQMLSRPPRIRGMSRLEACSQRPFTGRWCSLATSPGTPKLDAYLVFTPVVLQPTDVMGAWPCAGHCGGLGDPIQDPHLLGDWAREGCFPMMGPCPSCSPKCLPGKHHCLHFIGGDTEGSGSREECLGEGGVEVGTCKTSPRRVAVTNTCCVPGLGGCVVNSSSAHGVWFALHPIL